MLDTASLGTVMGIWAHPDDETYGMAGIMYACAQNGQQVVCVTATRGEAGVQDETKWPQSRLAEIRSQELAEALSLLGVKNHHWLDYPDGGCTDIENSAAVNRLAALLDQYQPDTIFTFGADGLTGHDDHKTVSSWASMAINESGRAVRLYHWVFTHEQYEAMREVDEQLNFFFNIHEPPIMHQDECTLYFKLPGDVFQQKLAALRAMPSQTTNMLELFSHALPEAIGTEAFKRVR